MQTLICGSICVQTLICGTVGLAECMYIHVYMYNITSKSTILKRGNIGMANMHKKQRRQGRDGLVMMSR